MTPKFRIRAFALGRIVGATPIFLFANDGVTQLLANDGVTFLTAQKSQPLSFAPLVDDDLAWLTDDNFELLAAE
jgi:hypothetical protein